MRTVDADEIIKKQKDLIRRTCDEVYANDWHNPVILAMSSVAGIVLDAPTIDPVVKHGYWTQTTDIDGLHYLQCSCCKKTVFGRFKSNYCSYCGAKMKDKL